MPVESRQGPIYFHAVQNSKFRKNYDSIFRKKEDKPAQKTGSKPVKAKKTKVQPKGETPTDNT